MVRCTNLYLLLRVKSPDLANLDMADHYGDAEVTFVSEH
jgi:hypothetical protein